MKQSPLYQKLNDLKVHLEMVHDWALPMNFGSVEHEYETLRKRAGLLDFSHRGKIKVTGSDRVGFLHNMLSNDIKGLKAQEVRYAVLLTPKGKIISDLFVYALPEHHLLECGTENTAKVIERLNSFIITEDVQLEDITDEYALLSIQGPLAVQAVSSLNLTDVIQIFQNKRLKNSGVDVWVPRVHAVSVWEKISGFENIQPVGSSAFEIVRIEDGIPEYGKELDENIIPNEAGLENAISFTKGCYPGQEIVARIKYLGGVQKALCGLILENGEISGSKQIILKDGKTIGTLTSTCFSPRLNQGIALGYIKTSFREPGQQVQIETGDKMISAKIAELPFYKQ